MTILSPVPVIPKVGPDYSKRLRENGIEKVGDLLAYVPFRYDDLRIHSTTHTFPIDQLTFFEGYVTKVTPISSRGGKKMYKGVFIDEYGSLPIMWFNVSFVMTAFKKDKKVRLVGKVETFNNVPTLMSPTWEVGENTSPHIGRIVPIYREFNGVTTKWLRARMWDVLHLLSALPESVVPQDVARARHLFDYEKVYRTVHFPDSLEEVEYAKQRLAYEELFIELLRQQLLKEERRRLSGGSVFSFQQAPAFESFYGGLPFTLSESQLTSIHEMTQDMSADTAMSRLLIGDVGSGKTVVAAALLFATYQEGKRGVVMAPTQILAQQHYKTLQQFLGSHGVKVGLIETQKSKVKSQKLEGDIVEIDVQFESNDLNSYDVLVGTHALIHRSTLGKDIGFVVVDEQHRFGVNQREALKDIVGKGVHFLSMTATPIPRSLSLLMLGHVDVSYLTTRAGGRKDAVTKVVPHAKRLTAYKWAQEYVKERGGQIFVICPFIQPSESIETVRAATTEYEYLRDKVFTELNVELLHGGMKPAEKDAILDRFRSGEFDVLVTTPVVEVGIDIPQANFIIIESAERFGLAQLHQLRGRVGRAGQDAFCFLVPSTAQADENQRLHALTTTHDGFALAEIDLSHRGSGTIFGTLQSGFAGFKFADISNKGFVQMVREDVDEVAARMGNGEFGELRDTVGVGLDYGRH